MYINNQYRDFTLLQNVVCINRSFWFGKRNLKIVGNLIFCIATITIVICVFYDMFNVKLDKRETNSILSYVKILQYIVCTEALYLAIASTRSRKTLNAIRILNEKCDIFLLNNKKYNENKTIMIYTTISILTIVFDCLSLKLLELSPSVILTLAAAFAAHDTELIFYYLIINEFNMRLELLTQVSPVAGMRIYRHILICASSFNEDFSLNIALMHFMITITNSIYGAIIFLGNPDKLFLLYLIFRILRSSYSILKVASGAYTTNSLCKNLTQALAARLCFDFPVNDKSFTQKLTKRWLQSVRTFQPRYSDSSKYTLDLSVPASLIGVVFNYILILTQILNAIKTNDSSF